MKIESVREFTNTDSKVPEEFGKLTEHYSQHKALILNTLALCSDYFRFRHPESLALYFFVLGSWMDRVWVNSTDDSAEKGNHVIGS